MNVFMAAYQDYGGLRVAWRTMSPVGVVKHDPSRSFLSQYNYAFKPEPFPTHHIKTIGTVKHFNDLYNQHFIASATRDQVDSRFVVGSGPFIDVSEGMFDDLELRHYYGPDWSMFVFEKVCGSGQGRVAHATYRAQRMTLLLENVDSVVKVEANRDYALDKLFEMKE